MNDEQWMERCLVLAERAWGRTSPNPLVGAVIVKEGVAVGEGFHPKAGEPHAEVFALRAAGDEARGATLYVNLEPCNHRGRTPPCTEAILAGGIRRVVVGMIDPNPLVAGSGIERLRSAGLEVTVGVLAERCQKFNEVFSHWITTGRPFGVLKYAMTLDGKTATRTGHSFWVSGEAARARVHRLRALYDATIVGGNTVRLDDPQLTVRLAEGRDPLRVVLSRSLQLPVSARLWQEQDKAPTLVFTTAEADPTVRAQLERLGVEVEAMPELTPAAVLAVLARRRCTSVLWECGGTLAWSALRDGSVQKVMSFVAPALIGGAAAFTPVAGAGFEKMHEAIRLERLIAEPVGADWLLSGYLPSGD
ncbi:bifunctional diaminohydroxyphosphoribosylaminopyrimidine deaminase/5-amino-6-(5-phosphoribosylamino)uracil reductase RibD [Gloeobacter kilaueensis]|uniref:Riboflavin biosynthesis protein RibD n=1 Tax=Gloeobacter kilaueensis (strain ATCC BAA-2537 / CCAP 1431/1 / ULC 316 / JS1) TaxID=1183438 RepID=U5QIE6_GLOK1|nr:bifunctional diaminohydroxyphosphoribosylaminopyrimidine deaminase/5-amino-6-(5-phosphoribosylamino)uracil reductase RibD [Gloeobacter kilaueensis]AGY57364.1 riboflavin biosynthesis protein RibD [Gloeobacter kilaueensis JS1]